jgi:hypothetical protein
LLGLRGWSCGRVAELPRVLQRSLLKNMEAVDRFVSADLRIDFVGEKSPPPSARPGCSHRKEPKDLGDPGERPGTPPPPLTDPAARPMHASILGAPHPPMHFPARRGRGLPPPSITHAVLGLGMRRIGRSKKRPVAGETQKTARRAKLQGVSCFIYLACGAPTPQPRIVRKNREPRTVIQTARTKTQIQ